MMMNISIKISVSQPTKSRGTYSPKQLLSFVAGNFGKRAFPKGFGSAEQLVVG